MRYISDRRSRDPAYPFCRDPQPYFCPALAAANRAINVLVERQSPATKTGDLRRNASEKLRFDQLGRSARLASPETHFAPTRERPDLGGSESKRDPYGESQAKSACLIYSPYLMLAPEVSGY